MPGEQEQLRRLERARAQTIDLALGAGSRDPAVARELDAGAAPALEEQPARVRARQHGEVGRVGDGREEGARGARGAGRP